MLLWQCTRNHVFGVEDFLSGGFPRRSGLERKIFGIILVLQMLLAVAGVNAADRSVDTPFAALLAAHVHPGAVDYAGLKRQESMLDAYLESISGIEPDLLPLPEQFAFYINAYNAWTLKLILEHYPGIRSIKEAGGLFRSPWKRNFVRLPGRTVSLDAIEHGILRPRFKDPRIHFAVNCASRSCPPLAAAPYRGETIDADLDVATRAFVNNPDNTFFQEARLHVSSIFDWYAEDFGGPQGVWEFIRRHAGPDLARQMDAATSRKLAYTDYDWSLNGQ